MVSISQTLKINEKNFVEDPFLNELEKIGWKVIRLETDSRTKERQIPSSSFRTSFNEVILVPKLQDALFKINPWLEKDQIDEVIQKIQNFSNADLIKANQYVLNLLHENTTVSKNRKTNEKSPTVRYMNFDDPTKNNFTAISQFKIRITGTDSHIYPDITLFVNGLPVVVIECKSPKIKRPISDAIEQILRYSEQRGEKKEGSKSLFAYNQFVITTSRSKCKFGTISTHIEKHFFRWTDPYPKTLGELSLKGRSPNDQIRLIHGMLDKKNLLNLFKTFTIFSENDEGKTIKIVGRYQQFRAVKKVTERLVLGKNKLQRGGIIWHTQGSGKSLTMMFTVREMYSNPLLKDWKIIFITDRTQLEDQLTKTSKSIGYKVKPATSIKMLKKLLKNTNSDLVMAMINKFQERDLDEVFPELNTSSKILVMTDEAHRTQYTKLAANLDRAIPESTHIAFTGTPTEKTEKKYKDYIDKYTMRQSIDDGVTLEIIYEGRTHHGKIISKKSMDEKFVDVFSEYDLKEKMQILGYASRQVYLESKNIIQAKSEDIVKHYVENIFPNGFKAQVVATSREAAARYKTSIDVAIKSKIKELEQKNPFEIDFDLLKKLKTSVVISGLGNDKPHLKKFTDSKQHKKDIKSFKMSFDSSNKGMDGNIGIIIVNNMLLTGFDAPIEQVMYLDKVVKAHGLLQAVTRVNRISSEQKEKGFVVDYVGIGHHLKEAVSDYDEKERNDILDSFKNEQDDFNQLIYCHKVLDDFVKEHKIEEIDDLDDIYGLFYNEDLRFDYMEKFHKFTNALDAVFPKKEALEYLSELNKFAEINVQAKEHLPDERFGMKGISDKLRPIVDKHLISKGIDQKISPISIIDDNFLENFKKRKRKGSKASEIEHAIRHHIEEHYYDDPDLYASISEAMEKILEKFKDNWNEIYVQLEKLRIKIKNSAHEPTYGLDRKKQIPFFRTLKNELYGDKSINENDVGYLVSLTQNIFLIIEREIKLTDFWENIPAINRLKGEIIEVLLSKNYQNIPNIVQKRSVLTGRFLEIAQKNNNLIRAGDQE